MRESLANLSLALDGIIPMSRELDEMYVSMLKKQTPELWIEKVGYPSLKPLMSWVADLCLRVEFVNDWLMNGNPKSYWMPGLFYPQGFLTGVL